MLARRVWPIVVASVTVGWGVLAASGAPGAGETAVRPEIDWPAFLARHDLVWNALPDNWFAAPYLGNGLLGSMLYQEGDANGICLHADRTDIHDHRDMATDGACGQSRARYLVGDFLLEPVGRLTGCQWRLDLGNAELRGTIVTDRGTIGIRHYVHSDKLLLVTDMQPSPGESGCRWTWRPGEAKSTRGQMPSTQEEIAAYARTYGDHYLETMKVFQPNPAPRIERTGEANVCVQNLLAGGQYATAWQELKGADGRRTLIATIANSYPQATARDEALATIREGAAMDFDAALQAHRQWWHRFYSASFVSLPDTRVETLYWNQIYKYGSATRPGRPWITEAGPWLQRTKWPMHHWNLNIQLIYWALCGSNHVDLGMPLLDRLHEKRATLVENVRPVEWQNDSAYGPHNTNWDLFQPRDADKRFADEAGNLPWVMHNCWLFYRHTMDDAMLREKIFPLLRRSVNFYRHMLEEGGDGRLHLPPTFSPESGSVADCHYDLALLRWGCHALLWSCDRLKIDDPLIPEWRKILDRLADFPQDDLGLMLGRDKPFDISHRHYSHLLAAYPLYLLNVEQGRPTEELLEKSLRNWHSRPAALAGYSYTGGASIAAALGRGDDALAYLQGLDRFLLPNGLYKENVNPACPVIETPLSAAQSVLDMLLQSWGDPAKGFPSVLRVFPAVPNAWKDVSFHNLRAEGAFLVSAVRRDGVTRWVHIESLAGEPCRVRPGLDGTVHVRAGRDVAWNDLGGGVYELDLQKGEQAVLFSGDTLPALTVAPQPARPEDCNRFGLTR